LLVNYLYDFLILLLEPNSTIMLAANFHNAH